MLFRWKGKFSLIIFCVFLLFSAIAGPISVLGSTHTPPEEVRRSNLPDYGDTSSVFARIFGRAGYGTLGGRSQELVYERLRAAFPELNPASYPSWQVLTYGGQDYYYFCAGANGNCTLDPRGQRVEGIFRETLEELRAEGDTPIGQRVADAVAGTGAELALSAALFISTLLFQLGMWILGLAGTLLEFTVRWLVLEMSLFIGSGGYISIAVQSAWTAIRDVVNIAFIGGLVWASIAMILNLTGAKPTAMIVRILVAAILVNFSFFFAAIIVDASNFLSKEIYEAGVGRISENAVQELRATSGSETQSIEVGGIGAVFMDKTRLSSILSPEALADADPSLSVILITLLGATLFIVTAWVFFQATFLLLKRFIILTLLLITSPIGILRWTGLPMVEGFGKRWWDALLSQALFAPVFMLLIGISFVVLAPLSMVLGQSSLSQLATESISQGFAGGQDAPTGPIAILALFALSIGFMWASLVIARKMSSEAKDFAPIHDGVNRMRNWAVSGLGTANRYAGGLIGGLPGAVIGGAAGTLTGKPVEGWKTGQRIGTNLYGRATTPLNIAGEKAAADIAAKPVFTDKAQKYYEKKVPNPLRPKTVSYGSDDFEKLVRELNTMDDEKLKEKFLKDTERNPKMADVMINAVDSDRRDMLRNAKREKSEKDSRSKNTRQVLDGDDRIKRATEDAQEKGSAESRQEKTSVPDQQGSIREFAQLQKDLADIRESSSKTADNTSRSVAEEKKQRVIEQLRNKEKSAVHEEYTNLDAPSRTTMREVINEHVAQNPSDDQLKEIADTLRHIETSPAGMVAPQNPTSNTQTRKRRRASKPKRNNKK